MFKDKLLLWWQYNKHNIRADTCMRADAHVTHIPCFVMEGPTPVKRPIPVLHIFTQDIKVFHIPLSQFNDFLHKDPLTLALHNIGIISSSLGLKNCTINN